MVVRIGMDSSKILIPLWILPWVIDDLVLGWDFLISIGSILESRNPETRVQLEEEKISDYRSIPVDIHTSKEVSTKRQLSFHKNVEVDAYL